MLRDTCIAIRSILPGDVAIGSLDRYSCSKQHGGDGRDSLTAGHVLLNEPNPTIRSRLPDKFAAFVVFGGILQMFEHEGRLPRQIGDR